MLVRPTVVFHILEYMWFFKPKVDLTTTHDRHIYEGHVMMVLYIRHSQYIYLCSIEEDDVYRKTYHERQNNDHTITKNGRNTKSGVSKSVIQVIVIIIINTMHQ